MPRVLWRVSLWGKSVHLRRCGVVCSHRAVSLWWTACCSPTARYSKWLFAMYTTNKPRNLYFQAFITPIISCVAKSRSSSGVRSWIASDFFFFFFGWHSNHLISVSSAVSVSEWDGQCCLVSSFWNVFLCCFPCCSDLIIHALVSRSVLTV